MSRAVWLDRIYERYGYTSLIGASAVVPAGVANTGTPDSSGGRDFSTYPLDFCHEFGGFVGRELRDLWLPTLSSTRLELQGSFSSAGVLTVLTNDVTIADNVWL